MATIVFDWHLDLLAFAACCLLAVWLPRRLLARSPGSTPTRRLSAVTLLLLTLVGAAGAEWAGQRERQRLQGMVEGFAPTYAQEMKTLGVLDLSLDAGADDPTYLRLIDAEKAWLAVNPAVADIYTFARRADGQTVLFVDSETDYDHDGIYSGEREARTDIGEEYESTPPLDAAFDGASVFEADLVTDRWGTWVSAFVPIRRPDGTVHSVLGVDYAASDWIASILLTRASVLLVTFLLLALIVVGDSLFMTTISRARATAEAQARQQFLAHMSHEIRTPMTAILGHADLLADGTGDGVERARSVLTIRQSGRHLLAILDDILDFTKLEAGGCTPRFAATAIAAVVEDVRAVQSQHARSKGLELATHVDPALPGAVDTDPRMLRQILLNLVGNAIKFTAAGSVRVTAERALTAAGERLRIAVSDTGAGISAAERQRLFQPFAQGQAGLDRPHGGTGLGLSISRRLSQALGGDIELASQPGHGSTFTVDLPLARASTPAVPSAPAAASPVEQLQGRVLVVDDGKENRLLLTAILRRAGLQVDSLADGEQCLQQLLGPTEPPPDLVLMDVQMPGIDGCETTRRLRAGGYRGPIVAVTAHAMPEDREQCLAAGCDDYVSKPIDRQQLLATARRLIAPAD